MSEIRMINLYRCSSAENAEEDLPETADYFVTDYFDKITVDTLDIKTATLQECMGIKYDANEKKGISHQRYCLYSDGKEENGIWKLGTEYPILTIIQVFINPDLYQAETFSNGDGMEEEATTEVWMKRLSGYIDEIIEKKLKVADGCKSRRIKCAVYRLLTAGDFAVIVRCDHVHDAYDIVTAVRGIQVVVNSSGEEKQKRQKETAFYTYSICGMYHDDSGKTDGMGTHMISWRKCLSPEDRIVVRIRYAQEFRKKLDKKDTEIKRELLCSGERLFGRYDHQIFYTPDEFETVYPYIRQFKRPTRVMPTTGEEITPKERLLINMMAKGYVSHVNERLLLCYEQDLFLENENEPEWEMNCEFVWENLYQKNNEKIAEIKKRITEDPDGLGEKIIPFYQSERSLKEYIRLLGRLDRVFYEINKRQELRISLAHLLIQYETLVHSLEEYLDVIPEHEEKKYAENVEEALRYGISALEIFTRYMRNVNQQTMQTPNYDLQTNVSVVKLLLAYSQFLQTYVVIKEEPYISSKTFHPIVVPSMRTKDMSVGVPFDRAFRSEDQEVSPFLMVIYCPTFAFLCETCFLIPAVFHEIAHQFRYEPRIERNRWLKQAILKGYLYEILQNILNKDREYYFENIGFQVIDKVYKKIFCKILDEISEAGLQEFKGDLTEALQCFTLAVHDLKYTVKDAVGQYIEQTEGSIQEYSNDLLETMEDLSANLEKIKENSTTAVERFILQMEVKYDIKKIKTIQEKQICTEMLAELKILKKSDETGKYGLEELIQILSDKSQPQWTGQDRHWQKDAGISPETIWDDKNRISDESRALINQFLDNRSSEHMGMALFEAWKRAGANPDVIEEQDVKKQEKNRRIGRIRHLLKQHHNVNFAYYKFNNAVENIESQPGDRRKQYEYFEKKRQMQKIFSDICQMLKKELPDKLHEFTEKRNKDLEWQESEISIEKLQYLIKAIRLEDLDGKEGIIKSGFEVETEEEISTFVDQKIELYREVTSDLFMCAAMELNMFGYLVVAAEILKFSGEELRTQLQRVFFVEQSLAMDNDIDDDRERFYGNIDAQKDDFHKNFQKKLKGILVEELKKLNDGIQATKLKENDLKEKLKDFIAQLDTGEFENCLDDIQDILGECVVESSEPFSSTRNWTIRIYRQIIAIVRRLLQFESSWDAVGDREILCDIVVSGYNRKRKNSDDFLQEKEDKDLRDRITEILNSPATHFTVRKPLLQNEINFIFKKYEKSCRRIFGRIGE